VIYNVSEKPVISIFKWAVGGVSRFFKTPEDSILRTHLRKNNKYDCVNCCISRGIHFCLGWSFCIRSNTYFDGVGSGAG